MTYHWTLCYLTPGGQSPSLWQKNTNTFWKPIIWMTKGKYKGDYIGDVIKTDVNSNDKRFHEWGQSENGMASIIEKFTYPGDVIMDPFLGGGTTGVCAVSMGRRFIGCDINEECINKSRERIIDSLNGSQE
jgi:site-specific DNA-methyltransferase (adenine-specific)